MFFNKFDINLTLSVKDAESNDHSTAIHLPSMSTEDLNVVQAFQNLISENKEATLAMMLNRAWFEEESDNLTVPVKTPDNKEEKNPKPTPLPTKRRTRKPAAAQDVQVPEEATVDAPAEASAEPDAESQEPDQESNSPAHNESAPDNNTEEDSSEGAEPEIESEQLDIDLTEGELPFTSNGLQEGFEALKEGECTKERVWKYACDNIPDAEPGDRNEALIVKGERLLLTAIASYVIMNPRIQRDENISLVAARRLLKNDLGTLTELFKEGNISEAQSVAGDAFASFMLQREEVRSASYAALTKLVENADE